MFDTIRKGKIFKWSEKRQEALDQINEYLSDVKILSKPVPGEKLYLYLAASDTALSSVLIRAKGQTHLPIYYVSQVLTETEQRYPPLENFVYALVMSVQKLHPYFFDHQVKVLTTSRLRNILHRPDTTGRLL